STPPSSLQGEIGQRTAASSARERARRAKYVMPAAPTAATAKLVSAPITRGEVPPRSAATRGAVVAGGDAGVVDDGATGGTDGASGSSAGPSMLRVSPLAATSTRSATRR